jgi:hypothetical protein
MRYTVTFDFAANDMSGNFVQNEWKNSI